MAYYKCKVCGKIVDDGFPHKSICFDCIEGMDYKCYLCKYDTNYFEYDPHCKGCDGENKFVKKEDLK